MNRCCRLRSLRRQAAPTDFLRYPLIDACLRLRRFTLPLRLMPLMITPLRCVTPNIALCDVATRDARRASRAVRRVAARYCSVCDIIMIARSVAAAEESAAQSARQRDVDDAYALPLLDASVYAASCRCCHDTPPCVATLIATPLRPLRLCSSPLPLMPRLRHDADAAARHTPMPDAAADDADAGLLLLIRHCRCPLMILPISLYHAAFSCRYVADIETT